MSETLRAHDWVEVRNTEFDKPWVKPRFDELVTGPVDSIHIEHLDETMIWMAIRKGKERQIVIFSTPNGRSTVEARTEAE